jgi:hypothetical protein
MKGCRANDLHTGVSFRHRVIFRPGKISHANHNGGLVSSQTEPWPEGKKIKRGEKEFFSNKRRFETLPSLAFKNRQ